MATAQERHARFVALWQQHESRAEYDDLRREYVVEVTGGRLIKLTGDEQIFHVYLDGGDPDGVFVYPDCLGTMFVTEEIDAFLDANGV